MLWETLLELARQLAAAPPAIAAPVVPETTTAAEIKPECVEPHQHIHSGWSLDKEDREFDGQWVVSTKYYSRAVTDTCDGTTTTEYRTEGPARLWPAVPDQRVSDVNRPSGTDDAVTGTPLRSSNLPTGMQGAPAVGPRDRPAANKPSLPDSNKPAAPKGSPFYPGALLLVGVVVAAWQQKRFGGSGGTAGGQGPDPEQELLDWKVKQFQSLARRGRWDARDPQFKDDPEFAAHSRPFESLKPETQDTLKAWQKQWDAVAGYWERFFADVDAASDTPPVDPWGLGDIARAQAAVALQGKLNQFRMLVDRLAANPDEFDVLSPALQDFGRSIEHFRSVLPLQQSDSLIRDAFAGDEAVVGQLVIDMKKQQYRQLAQAGRFDLDNPQFVQDERYRPFSLLKPVWGQGTEQTVTANQSAWKDAADYWHARLSGADGGTEPDDVLGVGQFARARVVAAKRQQRWEDADQALDALAVPQGTALDQERMARWAKVDQQGEVRGLYGGVGWTWSAHPLQIGGTSVPEQYLTEQIELLNSEMIPEAAALYVRNLKIVSLKKSGNAPTRPVPVPPVSSPEVQVVIHQLTWDQDKVNKVWNKASELGVDPRAMLAVIIQEGTGSFDTNSQVPVQIWNDDEGGYVSGGSGLQPSFAADLDDAMEAHILAKLKAYSYFGQAFKEAVEQAGLGDGNVFQYANYNVPWVKESGWKVNPGCYATHTEWWDGVSSAFISLAGDTSATGKYSAYLLAHPFEAPNAPKVTFVLTHNGTGPTERQTGRPWIEARLQ